MKVFVVMTGSRDYMSYDVDTVWSTREAADARLATIVEGRSVPLLDDSDVQVFEVDQGEASHG